MKNYFFIPVVIGTAALLMLGCNQSEVEKSKNENDSLLSVLSERNAAISDFVVVFNDVERNLDSIGVREGIISMNTDQPGELQPNQKARINADIEAINNLMDQNRKKITELNRKLKNSSHKNVELEKAIASINKQLVKKDIELAALNEKLNSLNAQVTQLQTSVITLTDENNAKAQTIEEKTTALHTAYYVVGKSKDLQDAKLIDRKGGLLGIGKTSKLRTDFDNSKFTRIDYTQVSSISVNSHMNIVTNHPSDSYTLDKNAKDKDLINSIVITNPEKFWSSSKYLVVVKD